MSLRSPPLRPDDEATPLELSLSTWSTIDGRRVSVSLTIDPMLFMWHVNMAYGDPDYRYSVNLGTPPLVFQLTET